MDEGESNLLAGRQRAGIYRDSCDIYYARLLINVPFHYLKIKFLYIWEKKSNQQKTTYLVTIYTH